MAAKAILGTNRPFKVNQRSMMERAERCFGEGLLDGIDLKPPLSKSDNGLASAVDAHTLVNRKISKLCSIAELHPEPQTTLPPCHSPHPANILDNSSKHGIPLFTSINKQHHNDTSKPGFPGSIYHPCP